MLSKAHLHMKKILKIISKIYNVVLLEEVREGSKKYDFYFPTSPPICIEVNGEQHYSEKIDGFFFKKTKDLLKYKKNDEERHNFHKLGKICLLNFDTNYFPTVNDLELLFKKNEIDKIMEKGNDEYNVYYQRYKRNQEQSDERKRISKEYWKNFKKKSSNFNRHK